MFPRLSPLLLALPFVELYLFLVVGREVGPFPALVLIVLTSFLGLALARSQGMRILVKYREATSRGRLPHDAVLDGLLVFVAGVLLILPGFLTDAVGFLLLVPPLRRFVRGRLEAALKRRLRFAGVAVAPASAPFTSAAPPGGGVSRSGSVINVEAVVVESHAHRNGSGKA